MLSKRKLSKKPLIRTCSDTRLKANFSDFIYDWNTQKEPDLNSDIKKDQTKQKVWTEIASFIMKPVKDLCRQSEKQSRRWSSECSVRCRKESTESDQISISKRRAMSESNLQDIEHVSFVAEFSPERQKRVCFGSPTSAVCCKTFEKRCCSTNRPRPILMQKRCIAARQEHMSYSNFKAWRRGSRLSIEIDVCSMPPINVKETKNKKFERLLKNFLSTCVNQMNNRSIPDM